MSERRCVICLVGEVTKPDIGVCEYCDNGPPTAADGPGESAELEHCRRLMPLMGERDELRVKLAEAEALANELRRELSEAKRSQTQRLRAEVAEARVRRLTGRMLAIAEAVGNAGINGFGNQIRAALEEP